MKNCFKAFAFAILCTFGIHTSFAQCTASLFAGGAGTEANPYQISTPEQLQNLNKCLLNSITGYNYYVLNNDIDLSDYLSSTGAGYNSGAGWNPIGYGRDVCFIGKFNGNGHKVSGLWINRRLAGYVGLFGYTYFNSEIRNVGVEIDDSEGGISGGIYVGGLVGYADQYSSYYSNISNSYAKGNVSGGSYVGGLVGSNSVTISNSYAIGSVSGDQGVGGFVGHNQDGTISNSYATGNVSGVSYVDGFVGLNNSILGSIISNSYYKTSAEMKDSSIYEDWDFQDIWEINPAKNAGYPTLFWQNQNHLGNAIVADISNETWKGSPITTPKPSVRFNGNLLTPGTHFDYEYYDNVQIGTATLKIVGKGIYSGSAKTAEFEIVAAACGTGFAGGDGTLSNPYKITEAKNLDAINNCLGESYKGKYYELKNDIDLGSYIDKSRVGWRSIGKGDNERYFYGKFDGNGHKVSGLWVNGEYAGLFGVVVGAEIKNIGVEIDDSKGGVKGSVGTVTSAGGLVARNEGTISNSYATGNVSGSRYVGGLVGYGYGTISNSYATGSVSGASYVGGLVGYGYGTISNSYATGSVSGTSYIGGLAGSGGTISNSYATGRVFGTNNVGGLIGYKIGTISNSYYDMETTGMNDTGKGVGKTTAEMKTQSTYEGWDFAGTWLIASNYANALNNGYPILQWQLQNNIAIVSHIPPQEYSGSAIKPTFTVTLNKSVLTANSHYTFSYSNNINAGTAIITITGTGAYSYLGSIYAFFAITPKPLTITGTTAVSREYDGTTTVVLAGGTLVGKVNSTDVNFSGTGTVATPGVGNNKAVTTNITLTGADAGNYTLTQPSGITANITTKSVTITGITASDKEYNGNTTATVTGTAAVSGKIGDDIVTVTNGTASFDNKNAGTNKTVTFANFKLSGTNVSNYTLSAQPASVTANITPKSVTITGLSAADKEYDGTTTATITGTAVVNGKVGSDVVTVANGTASFADKNVGTNKPVTFTGFSLSGTDASNYTLSAQPSGTANITAKSLTIEVTSITATNKVYDGTTTAEIHGTDNIIGKVSGDDITIVKGNASFNDKNVGNNKPVTFSGFSFTGTGVNNYLITVIEPISITANITAKPVTITGVTATSRAEDETKTVELTGGTLNGVLSGDVVGFTLGNGTITSATAGTNKPVTTDIKLTGTDASNYTLTQPTNITVTITAAPSSSSSSSVPSSSVAPSSSSVAPSSSSVVPSSSSVAPSSSSVVPSSSSVAPSSSSVAPSSSSVAPSSSSVAPSSSSVAPSSSSVAPSISGGGSGSGGGGSTGGGSGSGGGGSGSGGGSGGGSTPLQEITSVGNILVHISTNAIVLSNLPSNAKVEVYNLQGKRIYSAYPVNPQILAIEVQTGMYIVKVGTRTMRVAVR